MTKEADVPTPDPPKVVNPPGTERHARGCGIFDPSRLHCSCGAVEDWDCPQHPGYDAAFSEIEKEPKPTPGASEAGECAPFSCGDEWWCPKHAPAPSPKPDAEALLEEALEVIEAHAPDHPLRLRIESALAARRSRG